MIPTSKLSNLSLAALFLAACSTGNGGTTTSTSAGTTTTTTSGSSTTSGTGTTTGGSTSGTTTSGTTTGTTSSTTTTGTTGFTPTFGLKNVQQVQPMTLLTLDAGVARSLPPELLAFTVAADAGDPVTLTVELRPLDQPFTNVANVPAGVPSTDPAIKATLAPQDAGDYHWQVQGVEMISGGYTSWYPYNDGGLAFTICGSGFCPDTTGSMCTATDITKDPANCWACGNNCNKGWCDANHPDGGEPGTNGTLGCHTPLVLQGGLTAPVIAAVSSQSHCYYYAEAAGVNSQSNSVPFTMNDWYTLNAKNGQVPVAMTADPNGVAVAINAAPNDAGIIPTLLYFPNDGGCGTGLFTQLNSQTGATYHGLASDGTNVYLTLTVLIAPDAGVTDDQVWKIPLATQMAQILLRNQKGLGDIVYSPLSSKLYFISRGPPSAIFVMGSDGSSPTAFIPATAEQFGPSPALAFSPTVNTLNGTLYWTSNTGAYSSVANGSKILTALNTPTGITTFTEGMNHTDVVIVTTSDGNVVEWHNDMNSTVNTLATGQSHPDYPLAYAQFCDGGCIYQMTWLWEVLASGGAVVSVDFPN
jgi:hypothetical protein